MARWGKASMDWYRAARARYRGEISWDVMIEAEDRAEALDSELRRALSGNASNSPAEFTRLRP